jgi:hypothetical protein
MTSVFTPTIMTHSISWRQLNILYHSFRDFIKKNEDDGSVFNHMLSRGMKEFVNSSIVNDWIINEAQVRMKGGIPLRFIRDNPVEEYFGEAIYSTNYKASFASLAQLHRHRLAVYDICGDVLLDSSEGFYIPSLVEAAGAIDEWKRDLEDINSYDFP